GTAPAALTGTGHPEIPQPAPYAPASAAVASEQPPAGAAPASVPSDSGIGPVSRAEPVEMGSSAARADSGYSAEAGTTRTEVVGPTAFGGAADENAEYVAGADGNPAVSNTTAGSPPPQNPNFGKSVGSEWHEQPPSVVSQQFSTNPRRFRPEGYTNNLAFGGRHDLPPGTI